MMNWNDYITVGKWCEAKRAEGHKVNHKWFYELVKGNVIPSIEIQGVTYVRSQNLDDLWPRYRAEVQQNMSKRGSENGKKSRTKLAEILDRIKNIESVLLVMATKK